MASLLSVENLQVQFQTKKGINTAVDGVSFSVEKGRILGIVESPDAEKVSHPCLSFSFLEATPGFPAAASNWMEKN